MLGGPMGTLPTINELREAFQIQRLYERDARGGTRYTEILQSHFGVTSPDARLQRPEYLGGAKTELQMQPVPQTSSTDSTSPQGNLAALGTLQSRGSFSKSFVEHGVIIGMACIFADLTYGQGMHRMWSRRDRWGKQNYQRARRWFKRKSDKRSLRSLFNNCEENCR